MDLSVIIPVKDERANLTPLHERLHAALDPLGLDYEIVVVDDGSIDGSFALLERMAADDACLKVVGLRRNFGQTAALQAGIDYSRGAILVTLDGDLQNDPADIPMMLEHLAQGYDAILGQRMKRQDSWLIRKLPSLLGNWLIRAVTGVPIKDMGCTLRVLRRDLAESLPLYGEMHRFVPVLAQQYGAKLLQVPVRHHPRVAGQTKYTLSRTLRVVLDLMTVKFLHSYLTRPMHVMGGAGLISIGLGFASLTAALAIKLGIGASLMASLGIRLGYGTSLVRQPLLLLSVMLTLVGVQLLSMGLLGEVLSRTYFESQGKTSYAVRTTVNVERRTGRRAA